jgi:hypothetical protein
MKIVIQIGDLVNRADIEHLFTVLPKNTQSLVDTFVVYASNDPEAHYQYYSPNKTFGFHSPKNSAVTKSEAISGIATHLLATTDFGYLPDTISQSKMQQYLATWQDLCS